MPILVGIAGGTGSGKSTLARRLSRALGESLCAVVSQDNYYRDLSGLSLEARARVNFDHPDSIDSELLARHLTMLKAEQTVVSPRYDFSRHMRSHGGQPVEARPVVLVEGILVLVWPEVAEQLDVKIFVETPHDVRLARRVQRDIANRGRDVEGVLRQYLETVRPMHESYVDPSRSAADLVVPGEGDNLVAVRVLARALMNGSPAP